MSVARGLVDNLATQINTKKQWNEKISTQLNKDYDNAIKKLKNLEEEKNTTLNALLLKPKATSTAEMTFQSLQYDKLQTCLN
mgnify:CR=1 FL=1